VRIIAFAFLLGGRITKSADRRTQTLDRLVPNPEGFVQGMFQGFALGNEGLLGRWWDRNVSRKEPSEVSAKHSKHATGFALTLPALLDCQRVIRAVVFDLEA
jgi:hypothetical protein